MQNEDRVFNFSSHPLEGGLLGGPFGSRSFGPGEAWQGPSFTPKMVTVFSGGTQYSGGEESRATPGTPQDSERLPCPGVPFQTLLRWVQERYEVASQSSAAPFTEDVELMAAGTLQDGAASSGRRFSKGSHNIWPQRREVDSPTSTEGRRSLESNKGLATATLQMAAAITRAGTGRDLASGKVQPPTLNSPPPLLMDSVSTTDIPSIPTTPPDFNFPRRSTSMMDRKSASSMARLFAESWSHGLQIRAVLNIHQDPSNLLKCCFQMWKEDTNTMNQLIEFTLRSHWEEDQEETISKGVARRGSDLGLLGVIPDSKNQLEDDGSPWLPKREMMEWLTLLFWTCDMAVSCCTSYMSKGVYVTSIRQITRHYLKTWCWSSPRTMRTVLQHHQQAQRRRPAVSSPGSAMSMEDDKSKQFWLLRRYLRQHHIDKDSFSAECNW